jgi:hypothetical protein
MLQHDPRRPFAAQPRDARKELRIPIALEGVVGSTRAGKRKIELLDISRMGCRVSTVLDLAIDHYVVVTIPGLAPLGAQVRWTTVLGTGLQFNTPLSSMVVDRIRASSRA